MAYFPFFVDIERQNCLVVGGGMVAYRKIAILKEYGPVITVISPEVIPEIEELEGKGLVISRRSFEMTDLECVDFVVAATDQEELNRQISAMCRLKRIPVNVVDVQEECSFIFPALLKEKDLVVGISTGGNSPTIAQYLKKSFREAIPEGFGELASQLGDYRELVKEKVDSLPVRTEIFKAMVEEGIRGGNKFTRDQALELIERKLSEHHE